jgi:hypothetical protein
MQTLPPIRDLPDLLLDQLELLPARTVSLINPLVHTNAGDFSSGFRRRLFWRNAAREEPQAAVRLGRYRTADVSGTGPHILMSEGILVKEYIPTNYTEADLAGRVEEMRGARLNAIEVHEPLLYAAYPGLRIWGHWLLEMLTRIVLVERLWPGRFRYVLPFDLAPKPDRFFNIQVGASLAAYGVPPSRVFTIEGGHLYRFTNLYDLTGMPCHYHSINPALIGILRTCHKLPQPTRRLSLTVFLRGSSEPRGLSNRAEIASLLERQGAGFLDPNAAPFAAQLMAFRDSDMIVGEMGSNLSGAFYAQPESGIVSIAPCGWDDGFLPRLLQLTNALFADVRGPSVADNHDAMRVASYSVAPTAVAAAMAVMRTQLEQRPLGEVVEVANRVIARRMGRALLEIRFGEGGNDEAFDLRGFSHAESNGRWSEGPESKLTLHGLLPPEDGFWIEIEGNAHEKPAALAETEIWISVNGERLARLDVSSLSRLQVPVDAAVARRHMPVEVVLEHPVCPPFGSVADSDDMRRLGFFYQRLCVRRRVP